MDRALVVDCLVWGSPGKVEPIAKFLVTRKDDEDVMHRGFLEAQISELDLSFSDK